MSDAITRRKADFREPFPPYHEPVRRTLRLFVQSVAVNQPSTAAAGLGQRPAGSAAAAVAGVSAPLAGTEEAEGAAAAPPQGPHPSEAPYWVGSSLNTLGISPLMFRILVKLSHYEKPPFPSGAAHIGPPDRPQKWPRAGDNGGDCEFHTCTSSI